jgi:hypothetical protein
MDCVKKILMKFPSMKSPGSNVASTRITELRTEQMFHILAQRASS